MDKTKISEKSYAEEIAALHHLKEITAEFRKHPADEKIYEVFKAFPTAVEIAAEDNADLNRIYNQIARPLKELISEKLDINKLIGSLSKTSAYENILAAEKITSIGKSLQKLEKLNKQLNQTAKQPNTAPSAGESQSTTADTKDSELVTQLKNEIRAAIGKNKNLSDAEKQNQLDLLNKTSGIKVKLKGYKCTLIFDGNAAPIETTLAINGLVLEGKYSRYAGIGKEMLPELSKVSAAGKEFKTGLGQQQKKQSENAKKSADKQQKQLMDLQAKKLETEQQIEQLQEKINTDASNLVKQMDSRNLYNLLADKSSKTSEFLELFCKTEDVKPLCDKLLSAQTSGVINNPRVWGLFMENDKSNDQRSYYEKTVASIRPETDYYEEVSNFMDRIASNEDRQRLQTACKIQVLKIAGTQLPREDAENLFLKAAFKYGMALNYREKYSPEKFNKMNQILELYGYKINLQAVTAEQTPEKGAMEFSNEILRDMHQLGHKADNNKTIAIMCRLAQLKNANQDLTNINTNSELKKLYGDFCNVFYKDKAVSSNGLADPRYQIQWNTFIKDKQNLQNAKKIYDYLSANAQSSQKLENWLQTLASGNYISNDKNLIEQSTHHHIPRKYFGILKNGRKMANNQDNLINTLCLHPVDNDPHKEAHRFDNKEIYLIKRGEKYLTGAISLVKKDDTVYIPMIYKKQQDGSFKSVTQPGILLMAGELSIPQPNVPGKNGKTSLKINTQNNDFERRA